jgi:spectinomycin phosphotransferase
VKAPPPDLDPAIVREALDRHWRLLATGLAYLPLGFGDHHWQARAAGRRYFVTARDLRLDGRTADPRRALPPLEQTFRAVRQLRDLAGLEYIVPALPSGSGALVVAVGDSLVLSS